MRFSVQSFKGGAGRAVWRCFDQPLTPVLRWPVEALQRGLCWQRSETKEREEADGEMMDGVRRRRTAGDEGQSPM